AAEASPVVPAAPASAAAPSTPTPPTSPRLPTDKPVDTDPQVRPALTADKPAATDKPEVQPLAPTPVPGAAKADPTPLTQPFAPVVARPSVRSGGRVTADVVADARTALSLTDAERAPVTPETPKLGTTAQPATQPPAPAVTTEKTTADTLAPLVQPAVVATDKAAPSVTTTPLVQPPLAQPVAPVAAPIVKDQPTAQADDAADLRDASVAADQPDIGTTVAPEVAPDAAPKTSDAPRSVETRTLRALAERASRPVETNAAGDTSAPMTPTVTAATTAPSVTTGIVQTPGAAVTAPVEAAVDTPDASSDGPVASAAPEAAPSAETTAATREALPPTLSRASIEATAQIAAQILKQLNGRSTRFEMALTPDDLGRVDVRLEIDAEGRLAARLAFDNPAAATDLKGRADELRRQLEQQGFHLADDAFEFTQRDSGSSAFDRGQDARQGRDQDQSRAFAAANRLNAETDTAAQPARWQALSLTPTGVDMKV
ncbi:MAG: flagellar hook-length control protein FliK, partial [Brevundimonas sp.]